MISNEINTAISAMEVGDVITFLVPAQSSHKPNTDVKIIIVNDESCKDES